MKMAGRLNFEFFKWSTLASAEWRLQDGELDSIIPVPECHRHLVKWIQGSSHLIVYTHPEQVNQWLKSHIQESGEANEHLI